MLSTIDSSPRFGALIALASALALIGAAPAAAEPPDAVQEDLQAARAPEAELEPSGSDASLGARFYRFDQEVGGVPVLGAEVVISDAPGDEDDLLVDDTRPDVDAPPDASVTRAAAIERARAATAVRELRGDIQAEQAILPDDSGGRLVWRVLVSAAEPLGSSEVLVDARSGEVVRERDLLVEAQGRAKVFLPNAVVANGDWTEDLNDNGDAPLPRELRTQVPLQRLDDSGCLRGAYVDVPLPGGATCPAGRDFDVDRDDGRFEAAMAYFHIDRTQDYVQRLGFTAGNGNDINDRRTPVLVNAISDDNSFYDPTQRDITFGRGGVDDAEDGDVIVHEYGHALQDDQVRYFGNSDETGAMGEGFGDYLAATMASQLPTATTEFNSCIFEWDTWGGASRQRCLRRVDKGIRADTAEATCPLVGGRPDTHCVGEAWSGALWKLRARLGQDGLGRPIMDLIVLQSHFALTRYASFDDGARALIFADRVLYGGAHERALRDELADRKLLDPRRFERDLSFDYHGRADAFKGRLSAAEHRCVADQTVRVMKRRDGPNRRIDSVKTRSDGRYSVDSRNPKGTYYAEAPARSPAALEPDSCDEARSRTRDLD